MFIYFCSRDQSVVSQLKTFKNNLLNDLQINVHSTPIWSTEGTEDFYTYIQIYESKSFQNELETSSARSQIVSLVIAIKGIFIDIKAPEGTTGKAYQQ